MIRSMILALLVLLACGLSFAGGFWWKGERIGNLARFETQQILRVQVGPNREGTLPAGTVLYEYRALPEISTYIAFVNLKERDVLRRKEGSESVIEPISAYPAQQK